MIRIGICDDNILERQEIGRICGQSITLDKFDIQYFEDGEEVLKNFAKLDILFLDVELPKISGIQVKEHLEKMGSGIRVIFITSHKEIMQNAFGKNVFDFLVKPIQESEVKESLRKVLDIFNQDNYVEFRVGQTQTKIRVDEITYIESLKHYCTINLNRNRKIIVREKISGLATTFEPYGFFCCHKSYIVNMLYMSGLHQFVELITGEQIPVSRKCKKELRERYCEYIYKQVTMSWGN